MARSCVSSYARRAMTARITRDSMRRFARWSQSSPRQPSSACFVGAAARNAFRARQISPGVNFRGGSCSRHSRSKWSRIRANSRIDRSDRAFQNADRCDSPSGLSIAANISPRISSKALRSVSCTGGFLGFEFCGRWGVALWTFGRAGATHAVTARADVSERDKRLVSLTLAPVDDLGLFGVAALLREIPRLEQPLLGAKLLALELDVHHPLGELRRVH